MLVREVRQMGSVGGITMTAFPKQGSFLGRRVRVFFHYGTEHISGVCVRDDLEAPGHTILKLDDGRHVLGTECQYQPERETKPPLPAAQPAPLVSALVALGEVCDDGLWHMRECRDIPIEGICLDTCKAAREQLVAVGALKGKQG
jgi:hypothetical protein